MSTLYRQIQIDTLDPDVRHYIKRKADLDDKLCKMYDKIEDTKSLLIAAFPEEAEQYIAELEAYYEEEEKRYEELDDMIQKYIKKLTKPQLQEILLQVLYDGPEWQFERFVREYIEY